MSNCEMRRGSGEIRVLVGEDSPFMRTLITESIETDPDITVVGTAANGREVLRKLVELKPDCITLDLEMPRMDGLDTLKYIMSEWPVPVVILSGHSARNGHMALTCLEHGAVDFVAKTMQGNRFPVKTLISKIRMAASVDVQKVRFSSTDHDLRIERQGERKNSSNLLVVIGASTGGPQALMEIVPRLPADLGASVLLVQHMPAKFTGFLAERTDSRSGMEVREAEEGDLILPGRVLVAPGGMHLFLGENRGRPSVMLFPRNDLQKTACPSIDFAMTSFATVFKERMIGVILTGMGRDGTAGCASIRKHGGSVICQDRDSSLIYGMPGSVEAEGLADRIVPLKDIAKVIVEYVDKAIMMEVSHESQ
ncbi:MAG: chemotaxis-specific protein-glutamate methyltransferase CheB [Candidatus Krumholzibacteriota bacterium]|nr:chemotaxis-specific protein-glutamate methyltransferase CheB [Candidatus Krumholzibacteriota bacterium]